MSGPARLTRSKSRQPTTPTPEAVVKSAASETFSVLQLPNDALSVERLPPTLTGEHTGLSQRDHKLLLRKQSLLRGLDLTKDEPNHVAEIIKCTLVFAAHQAGTAVCVSGEGLLLTASHCIAETEYELEQAKHAPPWLVFSDGRAVRAAPLKWDARRDIALLQITHAQPSVDTGATTVSQSPFCQISATAPRPNARLICVGHPADQDLEAPALASGQLRGTAYDVLCVSRGRYRGMQPDQDPQDNSDIGALKHDCWTYWGHSGAPLVVDESARKAQAAELGTLVGLHSSWDDETGMRRGVGLEALHGFLREWENERGADKGGQSRQAEVVDVTDS